MTRVLDKFATDIGAHGAVVCVGGNTQPTEGGLQDQGARIVRAPAGIVSYEPSEMTVTVYAGTPVTELANALAAHGQTIAMPIADGSTIGGALAVGRSSVFHLGHGNVRDTLLQARFVNGAGELVKVGGPTVKNVTGFDLCRLLVGSLGTFGFFGEVILRTRPIAASTQWFSALQADPFATRRSLYRPASIMWDGATTWVCLEGHPEDVAAQATILGRQFQPCSNPPVSLGGPEKHRWAMEPKELRSFGAERSPGSFMALIGIGEAWCSQPPPATPTEPRIQQLEQSIKTKMDPACRLNPGRTPGRRST